MPLRTWFSFPKKSVSYCLNNPNESCIDLHLFLQKDMIFLRPHLPLTCSSLVCLRFSQMALVPVFKQSNLVTFSSVMEKQCSPSVYTELFTQAPEVSMINGDRTYCRTLKGSHVLGLPGLIRSHRSENYAWHIDYYPRSQKSKQTQNSEVMTCKLVKICIPIWHGPGALLVKDVYGEVFYWFQLLAWLNMSYSFKYKYLCCTFKGPWGSLGNVPCFVMIALSFCCLPLVLEINIRDLLL